MMNTSAITAFSVDPVKPPRSIEFPAVIINCKPLAGGHAEDSTTEAEQLVNQLDQLFGYRKTLTTEQQHRVDQLFEKIDVIMQNNIRSQSTSQQQQLNQLFDEVDSIYQARSFEALSAQEQKMADNLLDQLNMALT